MAHPQKSSLIHCSSCGENYSATYKFCPFCGGHNASPAPSKKNGADADPTPVEGSQAHAASTTASSQRPASEAECYKFDGQDVFDQPEQDTPAGRGGKRLANGGAQRPTSPPPINWPRLITFLCSLIIIAAVLVMAFRVFYPHLRQVSNPNATDAPAPTTSPNPSVSGAADGLNGMYLDTADLTLQAQQSHALTLTFDPVDWEGAVTWSSSDETCATVNADGVITNVNTSGTQRRAIITATASGQTVTCTVYCQPAATSTPAPTTTEAPQPTPSSQPAQTGDIPNGSKAVIANASDGLRVRTGPGTSYDVAASLKNDDPITVVSYAGDGWYEITYAGSNGTKTGYIMGEYISVK